MAQGIRDVRNHFVLGERKSREVRHNVAWLGIRDWLRTTAPAAIVEIIEGEGHRPKLWKIRGGGFCYQCSSPEVVSKIKPSC